MRYQVDTLSGAPLDLAVAMTEGLEAMIDENQCRVIRNNVWSVGYSPSTNWTYGGQIIEREHFQLTPSANQWQCRVITSRDTLFWAAVTWGDTPLIAAMRCYVKSHHGDYIDLDVEGV